MTKIRVLHLINWFVRGGIEAYLLNILKYYDRCRMQFDVCCKGVNTGPLVHKAEELKVPIFHIPMKATQYKFICEFQKFLKEGKYDVLHSHVGELSGPAVYAAKKAGLKIRISAYHNTFANTALCLKKVPLLSQVRTLYLSICHKAVLRYSTHISGCSKAALKAYFPEEWEKDSRFHVNYYGVDTCRFKSEFDRVLFKGRNGLSQDKYIIGHVGSFRWEKNHRGFLEIAKLVSSKLPEVQFVFVGDGSLRHEIQQLAGETNLDVLFLGNRDDVPDVMRAMDVMLFPSLREGFGMVIIEAASANIPVVASRELGLLEAMAPENLDYSFEVGNYEDAAQKLLTLLTDKWKRTQYLENSQKDIMKRFTVKAACESLYELYLQGL